MMLARSTGQTAPQFTDERGDPVYAAFCALAVKNAAFRRARENDRLSISSAIRRLSRTQTLSRHRLSVSDRTLGEVDMVSTFVRRERGGGNHTVARFEAPGMPAISPMDGAGNLAACAAKLRSGRMTQHMGFMIDGRPPLARYSFDPCPGQDFNGAGFLYFNSFLTFVDRTEWAFSRTAAMNATTRHREIFFTGNLDPGETLNIGLVEKREIDGSLAHHCEIQREGDKAIIARVFSFRDLR
jgi:probable biosynthetic protein (TIGR04099 family)